MLASWSDGATKSAIVNFVALRKVPEAAGAGR
jgi:hypothetical protein